MTKHVLIGLSLLFLLALESAPVLARSFEPVGQGKGLEARVVPALLFDEQGLLWVGSREGLFRFDGYSTRTFLPDAGNPDAISESDVLSLHQSSDGSLWIGTNSGGLNRYIPQASVFEKFRHDPENPLSIPANRVNSIAEGPEGDLWVATPRGIARLDAGTGDFERFEPAADEPLALPTQQIAVLHRGPGNSLWVGMIGGGVARWNPGNRGFTRFDLAALAGGDSQNNHVLALSEDEDGILWAGTKEGLIRLDPQAGSAEMVDLGERDGYRPVITSLMPGPFGQIWMTTLARGLLIMDRVSREWTPVGAAGSGQAGSLPRDAFMSLAMGPGQVFIGAWGSGVFRTPLEDAAFRLFNKSNLSGLSNNVISAVMATRRAGQPWLGSFGGGPQLADISGQFIRARPLRRHQMRESGVLSLAGPVQGRLYAGTSHGLYEFNPDGSQMALFAYRADNAAGIASGYVTALLPAGEDGLWVGLGGAGLQFFDARSQAFTAFPRSPNDPQGLKGNYVTALLDGPDGGIWVGTRSSGLNLCRVRPWSCEVFTAAGRPGDLTHDHVTSLYRDRSGEVWVATDGGGLNRVERGADGAISGFRAWRQSSGLLSDSILAIQEDVDGSLWLSGKGGISRLNPQTGRVVNFVAASGLPTSHFNADASAADERYLYFGSSDGLLVFEKGMQLSGRPSPRVLVTDVRHTDPGRYSLVERLSRRHFRIPYAEVFTVDLAVLDYSETSHRFAFRIQSDDDWTELGAQRRMIFHGLAPGLYEFQARGRDAHGTWGEAAPVTLEIVPPFWMTAWFRIGLALVVLTAGLFIHFGRQATLKRRAAAQLRLGEQREKALEQQLGGTSELAVLTPRQKEILQLIAQGHSTREIAELLGVSIKTVEAHRANLMERLEIRDVPGLVRLAIRANLVSLDD